MKNILPALPVLMSFLLACKGFAWPDETPIGGASVEGTPQFTVTGTNPADGAALVANNTQIVIHFSETVNTGTLSFNSSNGSSAANTFQVSSDNFAT